MGEYGNRVLPDRHPTARYVQGVVRRIVDANGLEAGPGGWETHVVADDKTRNAFVLPGGKIFVFSGILPIAQDSDGLAVILGHEIAHQVARHSAERMSSLKVLFVLSLFLESLGLDAGLSRVLLNLVMTLPNSRKSESEADLIGLQLANKACFDVRAARGLWQRMNKAEGAAGGIDFLSTHPSSSKRVDSVTEWADKVIQDRPAECGPLEQQADAFKSFARSRW
ncbi:metalloendopeptidase [Microbotryomycetes sp. JL201]|nr:metalloendopeptidase [Microbotryomycetes sp. JL201]